jgi:hypothetical protein
MKKGIYGVALSALLATTTLMAGTSEYEVDTYSLVGIEGGYSSFDYERTNAAGNTKRTNGDLLHGGVKIGAQSTNYRVFLSARFFDMDDFDYARMYGVEGQYMFNFSKMANFYIGINAGTTDMKFVDDVNNQSIKVYEPYYGGDAGFNIHFGDLVDWEIGARYLTIDADMDENNIKYSFDHIMMGYTSVIIKFKMD